MTTRAGIDPRGLEYVGLPLADPEARGGVGQDRCSRGPVSTSRGLQHALLERQDLLLARDLDHRGANGGAVRAVDQLADEEVGQLLDGTGEHRR